MSTRRGQALTEFALTVPMFFAMMLVTFEAARLLITWSYLLEGSREAARTAVLASTKTTAPVVSTALDLAGWTGVSAGNVTVYRNGSSVSGAFSKQRGDQVSVTITFTYTVLIAQAIGSGWSGLPFASLPITVRTQMRAEG